MSELHDFEPFRTGYRAGSDVCCVCGEREAEHAPPNPRVKELEGLLDAAVSLIAQMLPSFSDDEWAMSPDLRALVRAECKRQESRS